MNEEKPDQRRRAAKSLPASGTLAGLLLNQGMTRGDLRHAEVNGAAARAAWGIYAGVEPGRAPRIEWALLQALTADGRRAASHETAASLWGFAGGSMTRPLHLTSLSGHRRFSGPVWSSPTEGPFLRSSFDGATGSEWCLLLGRGSMWLCAARRRRLWCLLIRSSAPGYGVLVCHRPWPGRRSWMKPCG